MKTKNQLLSISLFLVLFTSSAQIKVACIGNSITYGVGIEHRDSLSYPAQMAHMLGSNWIVKNVGVGGATLLKKGDKPYWNQHEFTDVFNFNPDVVVIKLGTNDSKPSNWIYENQFKTDYLALIDTLKSLSSHPEILLCYPVPAYGNTWGISDSIIRVRVIPDIKYVAKQRKLKIIDLYKTLSNHADFFKIDKIHPDYKGAEFIAKRIAKDLISIEKKINKKKKLDIN